jgi:hypothetical protein
MSKIPTVEEKLKANFYNGSFIEIHSGDFEDIKNIIIEFSKLHVEAALKQAVEKAKNCHIDEIINDEILNAYPLENIK